MAADRVEVVRRVLDAYQRRDVEAMCELSDERCELFTFTEGPTEARPFRGHAGIAEWAAHELEPWDELRVDPAEVLEVGDRVLVHTRLTARGKGSSVELTADSGMIFDFRDGRILRARSYLNWPDALAAVGQSHEDVEVVRRAYAAFSKGDFEALAGLTDRQWVFDFSRSIGPQKGIYRGHEEIAQLAGANAEAFERFDLSPLEFAVGATGQIVVRHHVSMRGRGSGLEWEGVPDATLVWELRDGRVVKTTLYQRRSEALAAVALPQSS